jgi:hypothetical protein
MLRSEVFGPIGIREAPIVRTREARGALGLPWFCAGFYPTLDDLAKIASLYHDSGARGARQILHPELCASIFSTDNALRQNTDLIHTAGSLPAPGSSELLYKMGFHYYPHVSARTGKRLYVPTMKGSTGNIVTLYPNGVTSMRLTKAWPMPENERQSEEPTDKMMRAIELIAPF